MSSNMNSELTMKQMEAVSASGPHLAVLGVVLVAEESKTPRTLVTGNAGRTRPLTPEDQLALLAWKRISCRFAKLNRQLLPASSLWSAATRAPPQCSPPSLTPGWIRVGNQTTDKLGGKRVIPLNLPVGDPTHDTQTDAYSVEAQTPLAT